MTINKLALAFGLSVCAVTLPGTFPASAQTAVGGQDRFQFTLRTPGDGQVSPGAESITRFLEQGISVEVATVPQLASAISQYATISPETVIGAVASLAAAYPEHAVKIAEAAAMAMPDRALEVAMAVATAVPSAAIAIVVALAAFDPSLAPALAGLILPAAGGINQTAARGGTTVNQQEITIGGAGTTTPGNGSASPTGASPG